MKKLMIAAAIVCAAAMSQAAVVEWSIGAGKTAVKLDGTTLTAQTVQLYLVGANEASDMLFDERTTGTSLSAGKLSKNFGDKQKNSGIKYNAESVAGGPLWSSADGDLGREYYIVITAKDAKGDTYVYTSESVASSGLSDSKPGAVDFAFTDKKIESGTGGWVAQSVPEPTSGLLLLLGVAGLALRRRRA